MIMLCITDDTIYTNGYFYILVKQMKILKK